MTKISLFFTYTLYEKNLPNIVVVRGGLDMVKKLVQLLGGFWCGYLVIKLLAIPVPFQFEPFIMGLLLNPFKFLSCMFLFMISFILHSVLIKNGIEQSFTFIKGKKISIWNLLLCYSVCINFIILFFLGFWQTVSLLIFSIIYGIISIDSFETVISES